MGIYVIGLGTNDTFDFFPLRRKQGDNRGRNVMLYLRRCFKKHVILKHSIQETYLKKDYIQETCYFKLISLW
jgi:hypothetical protein